MHAFAIVVEQKYGTKVLGVNSLSGDSALSGYDGPIVSADEDGGKWCKGCGAKMDSGARFCSAC